MARLQAGHGTPEVTDMRSAPEISAAQLTHTHWRTHRMHEQPAGYVLGWQKDEVSAAFVVGLNSAQSFYHELCQLKPQFLLFMIGLNFLLCRTPTGELNNVVIILMFRINIRHSETSQ